MSSLSSTIEGKISLLEHFWQHSPDNMFIVSLDEEGDFVVDDINPAQEKNLNICAETVRHVKINKIFDKATAELIEKKYQRCLELNQPISENETVTLDGEVRHWNTMIIPIIETTPGRKRIFGISREFTELERAKDAVETLNKQLEERVVERTAELENINHKLRELAFYDELTGIGNRRYFELHAAKLIALSQRENTHAYLIMLDIDHFKRINDNFGHPFGDMVLSRLSALFRESVRSSDVLCRYGGEEFMMLLPFTAKEDACDFASRLQKKIRAMLFFQDGKELRITASMGLAGLSGDADSLDKLIGQADDALYRAKRSGRDRIEVF